MIYLKDNLFDIDTIFYPGTSSEFYDLLEEKYYSDPYRIFDKEIYKCGSYNFWNGSNEDSLPLDETGLDCLYLYRSDKIVLDYQCIQIKFNKIQLLKKISGVVKILERNYLNYLTVKLKSMTTNVLADNFFVKQLKTLCQCYQDLYCLIEENTVHQLQNMTIEIHLKSYLHVFDTLNKEYGYTYPNLFDDYNLRDFGKTVKQNEFNMLSVKGHVLKLVDGYTIMHSTAVNFKYLLKRAGFIQKNTKTATIANIFGRGEKGEITKVRWMKPIKHLKAFVLELLSQKIIEENWHQSRWKDTANCFTDMHGANLNNSQFSHNTDKLNKHELNEIKEIVGYLKKEISKDHSGQL